MEMQSTVQSVERLLAENRTLSKSVPVTRPFSEEFFSEDADVRFYTGLYSLDMLKCAFDHVSSGMAKSVRTKLSPFQEMVVALVKLRLDTPLYDLACRMGVDSSTISRILLKWFTAMHIRLNHLIRWPERDVLQKTMPVCFRESFGTRVVVIIDCFEVFIDRPSNLMARAQTWSNYKHHNTIKLLLGTTPRKRNLFAPLRVLNLLFQMHGEDVPVISTSLNTVGFCRSLFQVMLCWRIVDSTLKRQLL